MPISFRNPFTPAENEVFTPHQYLQRKLDFAIWNQQNPVVHQAYCMDADHHDVMVNGMCCVQHLQQCVEGNLLDLAGCKTGITIEPEGFQKWLVLAKKRLEELHSGQMILPNGQLFSRPAVMNCTAGFGNTAIITIKTSALDSL